MCQRLAVPNNNNTSEWNKKKYYRHVQIEKFIFKKKPYLMAICAHTKLRNQRKKNQTIFAIIIGNYSM